MVNKTMGSLRTSGGHRIQFRIEDDVCHVYVDGPDLDLGVPLTNDEVRWVHNTITRTGRTLGEIL